LFLYKKDGIMQSCKMVLILFCSLLGFVVPFLAFAADDGAKTFQESCSPCHTAKVRPLDNRHLTREQWKDTIDRMIDQGAEVPKAKKAELLDYLVSTHGPAGDASDAGKK
jgi:hypothetical protein